MAKARMCIISTKDGYVGGDENGLLPFPYGWTFYEAKECAHKFLSLGKAREFLNLRPKVIGRIIALDGLKVTKNPKR